MIDRYIAYRYTPWSVVLVFTRVIRYIYIYEVYTYHASIFIQPAPPTLGIIILTITIDDDGLGG